MKSTDCAPGFTSETNGLPTMTPHPVKEGRVWRKGFPPFPGWWNASTMRDTKVWRWYNGVVLSIPCFEDTPKHFLNQRASESAYTRHPKALEWNNYWPENARVPRVKPC